MITKIGIQNFRVFKDLIELDIAPVTIFTGTNDSGKSTLQKALFLLSNSLKIKNGIVFFDKLVFDEEVQSKIGDKTRNFSYSADSEIFKFSFSYNTTIWGEITTELLFKQDKKRGHVHYLYNILVKKDNTILYGFSTSDLGEELKRNHNHELFELGQEQLPGTGFKRYDGLEEQYYPLWHLDSNDTLVERIYNALLIQKQLLLLSEEEESSDKYEKLKEKIQQNNVFHSVMNDSFESFLVEYRSENDRIADVLYPSMISNMVLGQDDFFDKEMKDEALLKLRDLLIENEIYSREEFISQYKEIELFYIQHSLSRDIVSAFEMDLSFSENTEYRRIIELQGFEGFFFRSKYIKRDDANYSLDPFGDKGRNYLNVNPLSKIMNNPQYSIILKAFHKKKSKEFNNEAFTFQLMRGLSSNVEEDGKKMYLFSNILIKAVMLPVTNLSDCLKSDIHKMRFSYRNIVIKDYFLFSEARGDEKEMISFCYNVMQNTAQEKRKLDFINSWLNELNIAENLSIGEVKVVDETVGYYLAFQKNNRQISLSDAGFGVRLISMLLLNIAIMKQGKIMVLEEPESNLHPAFQSKLADIIVDAQLQFNVKFIVETHSEYLVRRFQYLVANKKVDFTKEDISISYFYHPERIPIGKRQIENMEIREDGILKQDFGSGFFDESTQLTIDLLTLQKSN